MTANVSLALRSGELFTRKPPTNAKTANLQKKISTEAACPS